MMESTALEATPSTFLCPSDRLPDHIKGGGFTNYSGNRGIGVQVYGYNGVFGDETPVTLSSITDGTSATAAMSEWLVGPCNYEVRDARRSVYKTDRRLIAPNEFDLFTSMCHNLDIATAVLNKPCRGFNWLFGEFNYTLYNHSLVINDHSCTNGTRYQEGAWTATSAHNSGANVLFADGHVGFVYDSMALATWRALGSRNGAEIAPSGF